VAAHPGWSLLTVAPSPSSQHSSDLEPFQHATALPSPAAPRGVMPAVGIIHSTHLQHQAHGHPWEQTCQWRARHRAVGLLGCDLIAPGF